MTIAIGTTGTWNAIGLTPKLSWNGQYKNNETGFYYLRARFYDPTTGQLLARDPLNSLSREAHGYVGGDPLNTIDPTGLLGIPGTDFCVDLGGDDSCDSVAEQHPEVAQGVADFAGGVADGSPSAMGSSLLTRPHLALVAK